MPDGRTPEPGGWNRIHLIVEDIATETERLRGAGVKFRKRTDALATERRKAPLKRDISQIQAPLRLAADPVGSGPIRGDPGNIARRARRPGYWPEDVAGWRGPGADARLAGRHDLGPGSG
jgi:hypothetical protein